MHKDYARTDPEGVVKFVRGMIAATDFGRREAAKAAEMLRQASNLDARDATSYARLWGDIYIATMEPETVATFNAMAEIFRASRTIEGEVPDALYVTAPYQRAKQQP